MQLRRQTITNQVTRSGMLLVLSLMTSLSVILNGGVIPVVQANPATVRRGYTLLERGWVNDAIATFRTALRESPQSVEARLGLAIAYQRAGQDANAWEGYQQVLQSDPTNRRALQAVGLLGTYRPEWQARGIQALSALLERYPQDWEARSQRALLLSYQGRFGEAMADYTVLLERNPTPDVLLGAAQVSVYSGDYAQGLQWFERYRATGEAIPNTAVSAYAQALQETGNSQAAVQLLETRLEQSPSQDAVTVQLRAALAIAYQHNQQSQQALTVLEPLENKPEAALLLARAWSAIARQSQNTALYEQAVQLYQQVLSRTPEPSVGFLTEVADVLSESPPAQNAALQLYQRLTAQAPQNRSLFVKQQVLANALGQLSTEALRQSLLEKLQSLPESPVEQRAIALTLIRLDPPDPALLPIYQRLVERVSLPFLNFRIAQIQLAQSNLPEARQSLERYVQGSGDEDEVAIAMLRAEIEQKSGNTATALAIYQQLLEQEPENVAVLSALGGIRFQERQLDEAAALYRRILVLQPDRWETRLSLVELSLAQNQPLEALAELQRLQEQQEATGNMNPAIARRIRAIQAALLQQRGFQPSWERY